MDQVEQIGIFICLIDMARFEQVYVQVLPAPHADLQCALCDACRGRA